MVGRTYRIHVYTERKENVKGLGGRDKTGKTDRRAEVKNIERIQKMETLKELHDVCGEG